MKPISRYTREYFQKFSEKPVKIKPFDPKSMEVAQEYIEKLKKLLDKWNPEIEIIGSTAFGIPGKGEVEIAVYLNNEMWQDVIECLAAYYKEAGSLAEEYACFNDFYKNFEVEVIIIRGYTTKVNKALHQYLLNHPEALKEYEQLKRKYAYSKREYYIQKHNFFEKIILSLPEN